MAMKTFCRIRFSNTDEIKLENNTWTNSENFINLWSKIKLFLIFWIFGNGQNSEQHDQRSKAYYFFVFQLNQYSKASPIEKYRKLKNTFFWSKNVIRPSEFDSSSSKCRMRMLEYNGKKSFEYHKQNENTFYSNETT